ncbi:NapC/NirT family cytochrome c [Halodesulfovibrio sp.]|uniref:cytochrome c3 family protein n=1 Tax=Halodesulfovibrio sp. TaxID=1912772 RepID=UPI0025BBA721|nr:NapC/NirT family cytochrome c [Halodesulfovibrio sp.]
MPQSSDRKKRKKLLLIGGVAGFVLTIVLVLASGHMIALTNTDQFCVTCHVMKPFRQAWLASPHGGNNPQGVVAQCVDCHLPHGTLVEYVVAKAYTGTHDVIMNMIIDPYTHDWGANRANREKFTYDNSCRKCHTRLQAPKMGIKAILAHREYLRKENKLRCVKCHEHVGHKDMMYYVNKYFNRDSQPN